MVILSSAAKALGKSDKSIGAAFCDPMKAAHPQLAGTLEIEPNHGLAREGNRSHNSLSSSDETLSAQGPHDGKQIIAG